MTFIVKALGAEVRKRRESQGWSQEQLAEYADLNRSYVGEIERGQVIASVVTLEKLAHALGIPVAALLHSADPATQPVDIKQIRLVAIAC
ncbi:MAG: helix-turn-helix transcriptional regulator [Burkholderiales bacterium]|nr:helix-turn-helix transcriptional regulator [Burkholderiales bacterium]